MNAINIAIPEYKATTEAVRVLYKLAKSFDHRELEDEMTTLVEWSDDEYRWGLVLTDCVNGTVLIEVERHSL